MCFLTKTLNLVAICQRLVSEWEDTQVLLGARDPKKGEQAISDIVKEVGCKEDRLQLIVLDTSSDNSVKEAAAKFQGELYGIINNAGVRTFATAPPGFEWISSYATLSFQ